MQETTICYLDIYCSRLMGSWIKTCVVCCFFECLARFHVHVGASESLFHCYIIHILYFNHLWSLKFCLHTSVICGIVFSSSVVNWIIKSAAHTSSLKACRKSFWGPLWTGWNVCLDHPKYQWWTESPMDQIKRSLL